MKVNLMYFKHGKYQGKGTYDTAHTAYFLDRIFDEISLMKKQNRLPNLFGTEPKDKYVILVEIPEDKDISPSLLF